jgi:hypothetical protein
MKRLLVVLTFSSIWLAACATPVGTAISEATATPAPRSTELPAELLQAQAAAIAALAAQLGVPAAQVTVVSLEPVTWNDGCLGVVHAGVMCAQMVTPGYRIVLRANGKQYEYHTNRDGSALVDATGQPTQPPAATPAPEPTGTPSIEPTHIPVDLPPVQRAAIAAAIQVLGLPADQVKLVSIEAVDWPDGCLGVRQIGVMCIKGPVPGFRIVLEAGGKQYEFHTNLDASVVTPSNGPAVQVPEAITSKVKAALAAALGVPTGDIQVVSTQIIEWPNSCLGVAAPGIMCAQMVTPGYLVVVEANGQQYEYHTNGDASAVEPASVALSWQRTGGIAGYADSLIVFRSGEIYAEWNRAPAGGKEARLADLSMVQQAHLQGWLARFGTVSINHQDPAGVADGMAYSLTLMGHGSAQPSAAEQQAMLDWADGVISALAK